MGFWSAVGTEAFSNASSGIMSNLGMVDYEINPLARAGYEDFWNAQNANAFEWQDRAIRRNLEYSKLGPGIARQGLEDAGYNPLLAVNSSGGQPFSTSVPDFKPSSGLSSSGVRSDFMSSLAKAALISQTNAQTDLIKKRTLGEGWQVKTLSRSEAMGLGANLVKALGFNFHDSSQETFLVAYNPITGELRNLGDTSSGLGTTGETTNAGQVDVELDGKLSSRHYYDKSSDSPYKSVPMNPYNERGE